MGDWQNRVIQDAIVLFCPQEDTMKVLFSYLYQKCVENGGSYMGVLEGHLRFLTRD